MSRLTIRDKDGYAYDKNCYGCKETYCNVCDTTCFIVKKLADYEDLEEQIGIPLSELAELCDKGIPDECKNPSKAIVLTDEDVDRWNEYKQLEEQGLLLKLPCKVDDTVWFIKTSNFKPELIETKIEKIGIKKSGIYVKLGCNAMYETSSNSIGKTVFLTQKEAEQALERMKEGAK